MRQRHKKDPEGFKMIDEVCQTVKIPPSQKKKYTLDPSSLMNMTYPHTILYFIQFHTSVICMHLDLLNCILCM